MTTSPLRTTTTTLDIYIKLAQYPIASDRIRERMREELFKRGIITEESLEKEVERKAIESQEREGIYDPFAKESAAVFQTRTNRIRDYLTDFYFGYNLPPELFDQLILASLQHQPEDTTANELTFNPELAPWSMLFKQGEIYESMPPNERQRFSHHLEEIKVVLIKSMISDQLKYVGIAKNILTIGDLKNIYERRLGEGKIGGKAAGMLLAWKALQERSPETGPDVSDSVVIPESYFLGADVMYEFRRFNGLDHFMNEKYRPLDHIRSAYKGIIKAHMGGRFPEKIVEALRGILKNLGNRPVIVRSSSLLEDNFGFSFAGKYESFFCPNQGTPEENLNELLNAIRQIYASTTNPDALLYRRRHGLLDYDERMAILIQAVQGHVTDHYFFPTMAGVGFSQNPFRWNPKIRREDGFLRLVWGIGTRAVDRVSGDYPRMIALSHPNLRPETTARAIRQYSQRFIDVIDMDKNDFATLPAETLLKPGYRQLRFVASEDKGEYLQKIIALGGDQDEQEYVLTFDTITQDRKFIKLMRTALMRLEGIYRVPVDIEFTVEVKAKYPHPDYKLSILQCRPLSMRVDGGKVNLPAELPAEDVVLHSFHLIPNGRVEDIRYLVLVNPHTYRTITERHVRIELGRVVSRLNRVLEGERFVLMGPGRWGSENIELGVKVSYSDIYNTSALIEIGIATEEGTPELSYGTHFFQDLVEGGIYGLPLHLTEENSCLAWDLFTEENNVLASLLPADAEYSPYIQVVDVTAVRPGYVVNLLMDGENDEAIAFFAKSSSEWAEDDAVSLGSF